MTARNATRRPPPKRRGNEPKHRCHREDAPPVGDPNGYSAPGHMGGQYDDHGYGSGHGPFGFTQTVLP